MGQRNQGIFSIEKRFAINRELTMTLVRLIVIKYFNRLTALISSPWDTSMYWSGKRATYADAAIAVEMSRANCPR